MGSSAAWNLGAQSSAPRWAVAEQLAYIQSMPRSLMSGYRLIRASSTVSLKASEAVCPWRRSTLNCARNAPSIRPISTQRSPVRSL
jgi:hypothetical protein